MKKKFEGNERVKRSHLQALRREFETLEMRISEGVNEYFSRVMTVANKMRIYGENMQDVKVVEKILRSLTEKFNYIVFCSDCVKGKQHRESIPKKSQWRATEKLQLIHADICGPITPASNSDDPVHFEDAVKSSKWRLAMDTEIESIEKNQTWELTELPSGAKRIGVKWIYKTKLNELGEVDKYKARLVAKGYSQQHGWSKEGKILIVSVYVDDLIYTGNDEFMMIDFKSSMQKEFDMTDLAAKRALRYLRGTVNYGILYKKGGDEELMAFTDSDYAGDIEDRKSTSGYVFLMNGSAVAWSSKKQPIVTLSTTEAEFVAAAGCACQAVWMRRILKELGYTQKGCTTVMCDNSSAIKLSKNPVLHGRSKHIDVRFHFLRNLTKDGAIEMVHCGTHDQIADLLTKPLKLDAFKKLREQLGVCEVPEIN
ncbi:hypothetical protein K2173_016789 [Erythroxylum novogranatense]|uniref:Reverse transcriptase Ty1/copia-type domain-containing protein n=1 Tax=Erythroxylum novogranatense TaxID=1862640 RepID=A0AAV8SH14_9ROSI|nr:hypothetical protein K2173_016789 [Erythroxylum novogranatense]